MKHAAVLILAVLAAQAHAQYKCTEGGAVSFQQRPCAAGATSARLDLPPPPPDDGRAAYRALAAQGMLKAGMNRAELDTATGHAKPVKVNRSVVGSSVRDQLVYRFTTGPAYVYLENGTVTSFQLTRAE